MNTTTNNQDDYDSPWKESMELYFKELMQFFFPNIAREIAWKRGYEFLDKELQQVVRDAEIGRKHADKLVRVWSLKNEPFHVMIHISSQPVCHHHGSPFKDKGHQKQFTGTIHMEVDHHQGAV